MLNDDNLFLKVDEIFFSIPHRDLIFKNEQPASVMIRMTVYKHRLFDNVAYHFDLLVNSISVFQYTMIRPATIRGAL